MAIRIPITRPDLRDSEIEAASRTIRSGWITQGPEVAAFETEFAATVDAPHAVAVSNCTVALELSLRVLGIGAGDDVVTVSHSFIATANSIVAVGARPVFCDVEADTYGMSPASLAQTITAKTRAIIAVHQIGIPCDLAAIMEIAERAGLPVIEDAACAIGSEINWKGNWERIGKPHGALACFSFHPRKIVTTGDGGMITTRSADVARRLKLMRQHAMSVPDTVRHHSDKVVFEEYTEPAFNYRMTDLQASVGRPQLVRLAEIVERRRRLGASYQAALAASLTFSPPVEREWARCNWQSYPLRMKPTAKVTQVQALQHLMDRGIAAKRGISNAHQEPAYAGKSTWASGPEGLRVSEEARDRTILIPLFHVMTDAEQTEVVQAVLEIDTLA